MDIIGREIFDNEVKPKNRILKKATGIVEEQEITLVLKYLPRGVYSYNLYCNSGRHTSNYDLKWRVLRKFNKLVKKYKLKEVTR